MKSTKIVYIISFVYTPRLQNISSIFIQFSSDELEMIFNYFSILVISFLFKCS